MTKDQKRKTSYLPKREPARLLPKIPIKIKVYKVLKGYADLKGLYLYRLTNDILWRYIKRNGLDREVEKAEQEEKEQNTLNEGR